VAERKRDAATLLFGAVLAPARRGNGFDVRLFGKKSEEPGALNGNHRLSAQRQLELCTMFRAPR
jgi:hypothetical protein